VAGVISKIIYPKTLTQNRLTILDLNMKYLIELHTIAGTITLGTFDTIEAARKYLAGTRGRICTLWPPVATAADLIESHSANDLLKKLETI
jgi:hypothetical protein